MDERLYHEAILALARDAAHSGRLDAPDGSATVNNPLCGDRVTVELALGGGRVAAVAHRVRGCVLCRAAAAALAAALSGGEAAALAPARAGLREMLVDGAPAPGPPWEALRHFRPAAAHRSRHECVLLPFEAAAAALAEAARVR